MSHPASEDFWIFGYGSLIWKPPPHFDQRVPGYIRGYVRRFWQASEDHRGTPEAPGRVVTLIERRVWEGLGDHHEADDVVWGTAYRIERSQVDAVKEYLDIREINGYSIHYVDVFQTDPNVPPIKALVYIGTPDNPQFVARQHVPGEAELAQHIFASRGPSGPNKEYLFELHQSLEQLCPESRDNHVKSLFRKVAILEAESRIIEAPQVSDGTEHDMDVDMTHASGPVSGQEETEPEMMHT